MTNETDSLIDELRAARERATQAAHSGRWAVEPVQNHDDDELDYYIGSEDGSGVFADVGKLWTETDAQFVIAVYNSLPALLDALDAARAERDVFKRGYEGREKAKKIWCERAFQAGKRIQALEQELAHKVVEFESYGKTLMGDTSDLYAHIGHIVDKYSSDKNAVHDLQTIDDLLATLTAELEATRKKFDDQLCCFEAVESEQAEIIVGINEIREAFKRANAEQPRDIVEELCSDDVILHSAAGCIDGLSDTVSRLSSRLTALEQENEGLKAKADEALSKQTLYSDCLNKWQARLNPLFDVLEKEGYPADKMEDTVIEAAVMTITSLSRSRDAARQAAIGECKEIAHARYKKANTSMNDYDLGAADAALKIKQAIVALAAQEEGK